MYINTLRDLAESISVSSLGKGATSVRYNYSRFHSSFEDSIFGSSDAFAGKMDSIGGGLLKEFLIVLMQWSHLMSIRHKLIIYMSF